MANKTSSTTTDAEAAAERIQSDVREMNEHVADLNRKASLSAIDAYETNGLTFAEYHDKVAESTENEWVASFQRAYANFVRELTGIYAKLARDQLLAA